MWTDVGRGVPFSHLLSRKEKVIRAVWGLGGLLLTLPYCNKGASTRHCQPHPAADKTKHKEMHAPCTQMGLHVSVSPFLALAQQGQPMT